MALARSIPPVEHGLTPVGGWLATGCALIAVATGVASCGSDQGSRGPELTAKFPPAALVPAHKPGRPGTGEGSRTFVGRVGDSEIFVGMYVDDRSILAYACDGLPGTRPWTIREWISGSLRSRRFDLVSGQGLETSKGDVRLTGVLDGDAVRGFLTLASGSRLPYTAGLAGPDAGLIRVEKEVAPGKVLVEGWIQLPNGEVRGILSDCACSADHDRWCKNDRGTWYKKCDNCC